MSNDPAEARRLDKWRKALARRFPTPLSRVAGVSAAIVLTGLVVGLLFDVTAGGLYKNWPLVLRWPSEKLTDLAKSAWILITSASIAAIAGLVFRQAVSDATKRTARFAWQAAIYVFASVAIAGIAVNLAKRAIGRARPEMFGNDGVLYFRPFAGDADFESFPSGHSNTSGALAMALGLLFPRYRVHFLVGGITLASMRIFVSAHYPSDMITGFLIGCWFSFLIAHWLGRRGFLFDIEGSWPVLKKN